MTLFYGVLDAERGLLRYANAGHPHAFRITPSGAERLGATSPPLGLAQADAIAAAESQWVRGVDTLLVFSDGIVEARNEEGEQMGEERVLQLASEHRTDPAAETVEAVLAEAAAFEAVARDDRTILALRI